MKRGPLVALILVVALTAAIAIIPGRKYILIDRCLDRGGAWNYDRRRCETQPARRVDRLVVDKSDHRLTAYFHGQPVRRFRISLGRGGLAPKVRAGDARVPEGAYRIVAHNPASAYYRSLRIGYPTAQQAQSARASGVDVGGDIMVHGIRNGMGALGSRHTMTDWTAGCIAVTDSEMDWLYAAVPDGTPIFIGA